MIGTKPETENQQNATVHSCFVLVGSRQYGVAQQKVEQPTRGSDFGWTQILEYGA